jgi:hypothetical protein
MEKLRVRRQVEKTVLIHNTLANAAFYFKTRIEERLKTGDREGIAFEYMSCLLMLAFTVEAHINFLGYSLIKDWNEWKPFNVKVDDVLAHLKITADRSTRPYSVVSKLKKFRDTIAHGKPEQTSKDEIIEATAEELDQRADLRAGWEEAIAHDAVFQAHEDVDAIWKELLEKSGLSIFDTMTHGSASITLIEKIPAPTPQAAQ